MLIYLTPTQFFSSLYTVILATSNYHTLLDFLICLCCFFFKHLCCLCMYSCSKISKLPSDRWLDLRIYTSLLLQMPIWAGLMSVCVYVCVCRCVRLLHEGTKEAISCLTHQTVSSISRTTGRKVFAFFCFPLAICKTNIG